MRSFILFFTLLVSCVAQASGGTVVFSGAVLQSPCAIEVADVATAKFREVKSTSCSPASNMVTNAVYQNTTTGINQTKKLSGYTLLVEYD